MTDQLSLILVKFGPFIFSGKTYSCLQSQQAQRIQFLLYQNDNLFLPLQSVLVIVPDCKDLCGT